MKYQRRLLSLFVLILLAGAYLRIGSGLAHGISAAEAHDLKLSATGPAYLLTHFLDMGLDPNPQLYRLLLGAWLTVAGQSDLAIRFVSLAADLVLGAGLIAAVRGQAGRPVDWLAGVLWAASPLLVWSDGLIYAYSLFSMLAVLTWWLLERALRRRRMGRWLSFAVLAVALGYSHALGMIVIGAACLRILVNGVINRRLIDIATIAAIGLAMIPYWRALALYLVGLQPPGGPASFSLLDSAAEGLAALTTFGANWPPLIGAVLALAGMAASLIPWRRDRLEGGWLTLMIGAGLYAADGFALARGGFDPRYVIWLAPFWIMLATATASQLPGRIGPVIGGTMIIGAAVPGLIGGVTAQDREDFRAAGDFLEQHSDRGDAILMLSNYALPALNHYYDGEAVLLGPYDQLPADAPLDDMASDLAGYDTVWLALYADTVADPQGRLNGWLSERYPIRSEVFPAGVTVRGFDLRPMTASLPPEAAPLETVFDGQIALRGFQLYVESLAASDGRLHPPSGWVHVTLYWEALAPGVTFEPRATVEDVLGQIWGQNFTRGSETFYQSANWQAGQVWRTDLDINLNPATPPGIYHVIVRVITPGSEQVWPLTTEGDGGGSAVIIGDVEIIP